MVEAFDMQPHGVVSADEDMNGISPNVATETCDVSDFIYSNSWMLRITGDGRYADALEKAFHNAAPGAVNRTFDGHVCVVACLSQMRVVVSHSVLLSAFVKHACF